jgi:hypothetical protein
MFQQSIQIDFSQCQRHLYSQDQSYPGLPGLVERLTFLQSLRGEVLSCQHFGAYHVKICPTEFFMSLVSTG